MLMKAPNYTTSRYRCSLNKIKLLSLSRDGWGGRIRTYGTRDQNPLPYRLATPQQYCCNILAHMIQENLL